MNNEPEYYSARKPSVRKPSGYVLWEGPSKFDGAPLVAIAIIKSRNSKTGNMVQTFILRSDVSPLDALETGADVSVCGDCVHRPRAPAGARHGRKGKPKKERTCYVNVGQSVMAIWNAFRRGRYPFAPAAAAAACAGRTVRLGAYGDPAAIPVRIWHALLKRATGHTGYTHAWHKRAGRALRSLAMASADSAQDLERARAAGWRTFRVRTATEPLQARELVCPASAENDTGRTCSTCGACNGSTRGPAQASVAIIVHGPAARAFERARSAA